MKNKHILYIIDYYHPHIWGIEYLFGYIIHWMLLKWYRVTVLTYRYDTSLLSHEKKDGYDIYRIWSSKLDFMYNILFFKRCIMSSVDVIHTSNYISALPARILWRRYKKPVILTMNWFFGAYWINFWWWSWRKFKHLEYLIGIAKYAKVICVSQYIYNSMRTHFGIPDTKLYCIYNALDYSVWNRHVALSVVTSYHSSFFPDGITYKILFYGRAEHIKWLDVLIKSLGLFLDKYPDAYLVAICSDYTDGESHSEIERYKKIAFDLWIDNHISFVWSKDHETLRWIIVSSDVVVIPSLWESFGYAVAEVCALEVPIISSNVTAIPEVVSGKHLLVRPWDIYSLYDALILWYSWMYNYIPSKKFLYEDMINNVSAVYNDVLLR